MRRVCSGDGIIHFRPSQVTARCSIAFTARQKQYFAVYEQSRSVPLILTGTTGRQAESARASIIKLGPSCTVGFDACNQDSTIGQQGRRFTECGTRAIVRGSGSHRYSAYVLKD